MSTRAALMPMIAGLFAIAACSAPPPPATGTPDDETTIRAIGAKYAGAWNKGDVATLAAMVTEDYEAVSPDGKVVKGRAGFEEMEKTAATERTGLPLTLSVNTSMVKWAGASAAAIGGTWTLAGLPPGMGADKGAWSCFVTKGTDGQWRMATGLVAAYVPPPAMPVPPPAGKGK